MKQKDQHGRTPLHYAVQNHNNHLVNKLLEDGLCPNEKDKNNETPVAFACKGSRVTGLVNFSNVISGTIFSLLIAYNGNTNIVYKEDRYKKNTDEEDY